MNVEKLKAIRAELANWPDRPLRQLLDALLDDGPMFGAAELADKFKAAEPVDAGKPPESFRGVPLGPYWAPADDNPAGTAKAANELGITAEQYRGIQSGAVVLVEAAELSKLQAIKTAAAAVVDKTDRSNLTADAHGWALVGKAELQKLLAAVGRIKPQPVEAPAEVEPVAAALVKLRESVELLDERLAEAYSSEDECPDVADARSLTAAAIVLLRREAGENGPNSP